jgi:hypothetical protein
LWGYATARLPIAASTSLLYLVPPVAVFIAWVWLGEIPVTSELFGGVVVIAGVVVISQGAGITRVTMALIGLTKTVARAPSVPRSGQRNAVVAKYWRATVEPRQQSPRSTVSGFR